MYHSFILPLHYQKFQNIDSWPDYDTNAVAMTEKISVDFSAHKEKN